MKARVSVFLFNSFVLAYVITRESRRVEEESWTVVVVVTILVEVAAAVAVAATVAVAFNAKRFRKKAIKEYTIQKETETKKTKQIELNLSFEVTIVWIRKAKRDLLIVMILVVPSPSH